MLNQATRLETVQSFLKLDLSRQQELQDIVTLAAEICQTPIALITFMGEDMQWIRFKVGVDITENTRENSFCQYLVDEPNLMIVEDTLADERFAHHPLVADSPNIRFYAGAPLTTQEGHHLGTLCVFDQQPHALTAQQQNLLRILSKQVTHIMELEMSVKLLKEHIDEINSQKKKLETSETKLRSFLDSSSTCHILLGKNMEVLNFNKVASEFLKTIYRKQVAPGMVATEHLSATFVGLFQAVFPEVLEGSNRRLEYLVNYGIDGQVWWEILFSPAYDIYDEIVGVSVNATNINERKRHTERITAQNKALARIAHIQSHGLRKPVASIMGLINVIKADDYEDPRESLMQMEKAVQELDDTIHAIVRQTELIPPDLTTPGMFNTAIA